MIVRICIFRTHKVFRYDHIQSINLTEQLNNCNHDHTLCMQSGAIPCKVRGDLNIDIFKQVRSYLNAHSYTLS